MSRLSRGVGTPISNYAGVSLGGALNFQPVFGESGSSPIPPLEYAEAGDEHDAATEAELLGYELDPESWQPLQVGGSPSNPVLRFVDGSISSTTAGLISAGGVRRPVLMSTLGAAELFLAGRSLSRPQNGYRVVLAAAFVSNGVPLRLLETLGEQLAGLGIQLLDFETADLTANFDTLRSRTWNFLRQEMEGLEKEIVLARPGISTLADGLLERRLTTSDSHRNPVVGMVKRNLRQYLPNALLPRLYELTAGHRSPAFIIRTPNAELVSWYLKVAGGTIGPGGGLIRLAFARDYLESRFSGNARFDEISAISHQLFKLRCREESYSRHLVSLEPILRLEDQLRALLPGVDLFASRLRKHLGRH